MLRIKSIVFGFSVARAVGAGQGHSADGLGLGRVVVDARLDDDRQASVLLQGLDAVPALGYPDDRPRRLVLRPFLQGLGHQLEPDLFAGEVDELSKNSLESKALRRWSRCAGS
jgi:hypothetical protein